MPDVDDLLPRWELDPVAAAAELDRRLRAATPRAVIALETAYRRRQYSLARVLGCDPSALDPFYGAFATAVAALLTFDRSGYLREAGLRWLAARDDPFVLPFLLLRVNDPVEPVRELAADALGRRPDLGDASALVDLLPVIDGLARRRRGGQLVRAVTDALRGDPAGRAALWAGARTGDAFVRASCLRLLATVEPAAAVEHAFGTEDAALRAWAAGVAVAPGLDVDARSRVLPLLERDRNPRVRWRALRARARDPDGEPYLRRALLDPDARVRYLARVSLRARGHGGSADLYRRTLDGAGPGLVGALAGLGDLGGRDDAGLVLRFVDHPSARVRAEAWRALAAVDPEAFAARLGRVRADRSGKVRRIAS